MKSVMAWLPWCVLLAGCQAQDAHQGRVLEQVHRQPVEFSVQGEGELRAVKSTPLVVPGRQWTPRQLSWMLPDGSIVAKGDLVARFSAEQSRQDLAQARIDLERNALARAAKQAELADKHGQLGVDLVQVAGQLAIALRYAHASIGSMARNDILDAVQDSHYLGVRQHILQWREDQSTARGKAELAVLDAQRSTFDTVAKQKKADLDALELRAPHDGVLVLDRDWSDQVPHVGSSLWAGNSFASLPDLGALEVQLAVPQIEAQGIAVGAAVELHPRGLPAQTVHSTLSWVASAAQTRSRDNPVKYLLMKARVPAAAVHRFGWVPGQRFNGRIILFKSGSAISVPNVAFRNDGEGASVLVLSDGKVTPRELQLGVRGAVRSQVLKGLQEGDQVVVDAGPTGGKA